MSIELTSQEKIQIIDNHIKNLKLNKYNLDLSILEESNIEDPSSEKIDKLNQEVSDTNNRISILEAEKLKIQE
jgi:hypothetical protein